MAENTVYIIDLNDKVTGKLKNIQAQGRKTDGIFSGIGNTLGALGVGVGIASLTSLARGIYDITAGAEQTKIQFEVMLGSAEKAGQMIKGIRDFAAATPFETKDLENAATTMLGFGIAAEDIMPNIKMLGDVAGGNADKFGRITYAFSQISATGRLMGQDLLQLINAGFNPLQTISEKTGLSIGVLKKKMEDGLISSEMVKAAFQIETSEGGRFFQMMEKQSKTLDGRMSTLRDNIKMIGLDIGQTASGGFAKFIEVGIQAVEMIRDSSWSDFFSSWKDLYSILLPIGDAFSGLMQMFGMGSDLGIGFQHVIDSITVSIRLLLLPIRAVTDAVGLLIELITSTLEASVKLGSGDISGAKESFSGIGSKYDKLKSDFTSILDFEGGRGFGETIKKTDTGVSPIKGFVEGIGSKIGDLFSGLFDEKSKDKKTKKQTAGGLTLNESKNGSTNITFNIDKFQNNEFTKDGSTINNQNVQSALDQMKLALQTILNDTYIVAKQ